MFRPGAAHAQTTGAAHENSQARLCKTKTDDGLVEMYDHVPIGKEYTIDLDTRRWEEMFNIDQRKRHWKQLVNEHPSGRYLLMEMLEIVQ